MWCLVRSSLCPLSSVTDQVIRENPASRGTEASRQRFLSVRPGGWSRCVTTLYVHVQYMVRAAQASPDRFWGHILRGRWGWTPTD